MIFCCSGVRRSFSSLERGQALGLRFHGLRRGLDHRSRLDPVEPVDPEPLRRCPWQPVAGPFLPDEQRMVRGRRGDAERFPDFIGCTVSARPDQRGRRQELGGEGVGQILVGGLEEVVPLNLNV